MASQPAVLTLRDHVSPTTDVVFRELDGEAVLLHLGTAIYFGLNAVGTRIWLLLQEDSSLQRAYDRLLADYDVPPEKLEQDLLALVGQLCGKGLLQVSLPASVS